MRISPIHFRSKSNDNSHIKPSSPIAAKQSKSFDINQPPAQDSDSTSVNLSLPLLPFDQISFNHNSFNTTLPQSFYSISSYDENCIEESKIKQIVCIRLDEKKYLIFSLLCFLTGFIIAVISELSPSIKFKLKFKACSLKQSTHLLITANDNSIHLIEISPIDLPQLHSCNILHYTKMPINAYQTKLFEFKLHKYAFNYQSNSFVNIKFVLHATFDQICRKMTNGLTNEEIIFQRALYQFQNEGTMAIRSLFGLLLTEIMNPFYLVQLCCVIFWLKFRYANYALLLIASTITTLFLAIFEIKLNLNAIYKISRYSCEVVVYRVIHGVRKSLKVNSQELLPGDIFEIPSENIIMPCDALLINGNVIMNESFLSGESNPIFKSHIPNSNEHFKPKSDQRYILFSGTKIIQSKNKAIGLVIGIGADTEKGNLIRAILFKESNIESHEEIWKIISYVTIVGLFFIVIFIPKMISFDFPFGFIIIKVLDLLSTIMSPALPGCIVIIISISLFRIKQKGINCLNRSKISIVGHIDLIVFDKTGTLTEDHIDLEGFRLISKSKGKFVFDYFRDDLTPLLKETYKFYKERYISSLNNLTSQQDKLKQLHMYAIECLACCNSLTKSNNKLIGDPIDLEMFNSTNWEFEENMNNDSVQVWFRPKQETPINNLQQKIQLQDDDILQGRYDIGIIRRFDFVSKLQRMSVICKNINENFFKVFSKGSPEKVRELCLPSTIPSNYSKILAKYTNQGLRLIAMCFKMIKMDYIQSQKIARESIEHDMNFLGFFIVANKLRPHTKDTINVVHEAEIETIIATGDNLFTAASVGRECHIIPEEQPIYKCEVLPLEGSAGYQLFFNEIIIDLNEDEEEEEEDEDSNSSAADDSDTDSIDNVFRNKRKMTNNLAIDSVSEDDIESESDGYEETDIHLIIKHKPSELKSLKIDNNQTIKNNSTFAVSGSTFEILYKLHKRYYEDPSIAENQAYYEIFQLILDQTLIYGRMTPENKTLLIDCLKKKKNYTVAMCGDGANDIGALRTANVGISLGLDATSISAHFICESSEIKCLIRIICEGKACEANIIECYKYLIMMSFIQFFASLFLLNINTSLSNNQFLLNDFFIIFPMAILISRAHAIKLLTNDYPPDLSLASLLPSTISQTIIAICFQYGLLYLLKSRPWYVEYKRIIPVTEDEIEPSSENTIFFLLSYLQNLIVINAVITGKPFKNGQTDNKPFMLYLICSFLFGIFLILVPNGLDRMFQLVEMNDQNFRFYFILIAIANSVLAHYTEREIIPKMKKWYHYRYKNSNRT